MPQTPRIQHIDSLRGVAVLLMVMVTIAIFTFSILMYFAEKDVDEAQQEINSLTGNLLNLLFRNMPEKHQYES